MKSSNLVTGATGTIGRDVAKTTLGKRRSGDRACNAEGSVIGTNIAYYCRVPKKAPMKPIFITALNNRWLDGLLNEPRPCGNHKQDGQLVRARRRWRRSFKILLVAIFPVILACASSARAQISQSTHKPSSELQKEGDYYVGNWKLTGETKANAFGRGGQKFESSERLERMPGGFFLLARSYEGEKWTQITIIGYDENKKIFTHTAYNTRGEIEVMEGTEQGDTEIWSGDGKVDGKPLKQRLTIKRVSPTRYTFKFEMAPRGGDWSLVYEGQGTKEG